MREDWRAIEIFLAARSSGLVTFPAGWFGWPRERRIEHGRKLAAAILQLADGGDVLAEAIVRREAVHFSAIGLIDDPTPLVRLA
jgi:hypothetical protein